jgi:hypothetical protein
MSAPRPSNIGSKKGEQLPNRSIGSEQNLMSLFFPTSFAAAETMVGAIGDTNQMVGNEAGHSGDGGEDDPSQGEPDSEPGGEAEAEAAAAQRPAQPRLCRINRKDRDAVISKRSSFVSSSRDGGSASASNSKKIKVESKERAGPGPRSPNSKRTE